MLHKLLITTSILTVILLISLRLNSNEENDKIKEEEQDLGPPKFSKNSGFYPEDFKLTLTAGKNIKIYYTTDASNPRNSSTSKEYTEPILIYDRSSEPNIYSAINGTDDTPVSISRGHAATKFIARPYPEDKAMVIRAVSKNSKGEFSEIISNVYFITNKVLNKYKNYTIVSIVTNPENLFDPDYGIYVTGTMYQDWLKNEYRPGPPWDTTVKCNFFMKGSSWEREANLTLFDKGNLKLEQNIGIRVKGDGSRAYPTKGFNLYAKKKYGKNKIEKDILNNNNDIKGNLIKSYKTLSLRSTYPPDRIKEKIGRDLYYDRNISSTNMIPSVLFLNGEYWGFYYITEKIDNNFFEEKYLIPSDDVSVLKNNEVEDGPEEELISFQNFCLEYSKKNVSDSKIYEEINNFMDIDSFIELFATELYILNEDWTVKNDGEWRNMGEKIEGNEYSDGKWRFIVFDIDKSMGKIKSAEFDTLNYTLSLTEKIPHVALFVNLLKNNKDFQNKFINVYCDYGNEVYSPNKVKNLINKYKEEMNDIMPSNLLRWADVAYSENYTYSKQYFFESLDIISDFFERRHEYSYLHIQNFVGLNENVVELNVEIKGKGKIKISTIIPEINNGKWTGIYFTGIPRFY